MTEHSAGPALGVRLPNWVGDVCMALPALHLLIEHGFQLRLVGRGWATDLLAGFGLPVQSLAKGLRPAAAQWRSLGCPRGLLLTNSLSSAAQARLGGVAALGYRGEGRRLLLGKSLPRPRDRSHEVERLFALAVECCRWHGMSPHRRVPGPRLNLPLSYHHLNSAATARREAGVHADYVVIAPLAVGSLEGRSKQWQHFTELARRLQQQGYQLLACPGPGEEEATKALLPQATLLRGLGLGTYAAICQGAQLVVGNDSGPAHLAAAVGARTLAIFGLGQPWRTAPWGGAWIGSAEAWPSVDTVLAACHDLLQPSLALRAETHP